MNTPGRLRETRVALCSFVLAVLVAWSEAPVTAQTAPLVAVQASGEARGTTLAAAPGASAPAQDPRLAVKAIAERVQPTSRGGRETTELVNADEVVPGDEVIYTLEIRNTSTVALPHPTVDYPIPEHMRYVANSAIGAGADVSYSVDQGHRFDRPENLKIADAHGERPATAADYTHIRWQLKHVLKPNSVAMAHFRAVVK
jgi:uncharacterized repeat protein (TIGR01451 family)